MTLEKIRNTDKGQIKSLVFENMLKKLSNSYDTGPKDEKERREKRRERKRISTQWAT